MNNAFGGVPAAHTRKILGENAIRFYNLDRRPLDEIAARIGPTVEDVFAGGEMPQPVLDSFPARSGYLKPVGAVGVNAIDTLWQQDFVHRNGSAYSASSTPRM